MHCRRRAARAFTLIELLIVVAIIAILAAIAVPNFLEAQTRSKVSRVKNDMRSLVTAMEAYRVDNNQYPPDRGVNEMGSWIYLTTPVAFMTSVPLDPFPTSNPTHVQHGKGLPFAYLNTATNSDWSTDAAQWGMQWGMVSPGPNAWLDWQRTATFTTGTSFYWGFLWKPAQWNAPAMVYDPTNGTTSDGDLIRTNLEVS